MREIHTVTLGLPTEPAEIFDPTVVRLALIVREQKQIDVLGFLIRVSRLL